ncbi:hypothetical protein ACLMJK_002903 [Lecanora helva]
MRIFTAIISLLASSSASPLMENRQYDPNSVVAKRSHYPSKVLVLCESADNCETYESSSGTMIRFKEGMEPGSEAFKAMNAHSKRDDGYHTHVTFGDSSINYGDAGASGTGGIFHHLYDTCHEGSCDTSSASYEANAVISGAYSKINLIIHPQGQYDGYNQRNAFVEAMTAAAGQGEQWQNVTWYLETNSLTGQRTPEGALNQCTQTNFISINRFKDGNLQGFMTVRVEQEVEKSGFCSTITGILGDISGAVGAIPGAGEAAGVAGGFFGIVNSLCGG